MWRSPSSSQIHQKYMYMWNNSYRTPTECWQKTSDFPKGKKLPTYLGRAKEKRKNRDKRIRMGPTTVRELWTRKRFHTIGTPSLEEMGGCGGWRGEASEPWRRVQQQGCRGHGGAIPAQRISADQHSPAQETCLLTRWGGRGLGADLQLQRSVKGEDWSWLREHSLKGASVPQLAGREARKKSGPA